ncbi:hypothetical protein HPB49_013751 [Dermacentor silvarum]|uniref:Uncharacterized protein n=1 Tax=Dermacentor silvarum TaxID=543639 RepID=A0ACB8CL31_DERSI|nr:hypothetical protein HPB49_013751 [Dermacentor silvarum]
MKAEPRLCLVVVLLYPVIGHFGYQVTVRQAMVLAWMSVKGTFLASIATVQHLRRENVYTESITKSYLYAIGDMMLTQLINVTFLPVVLSALGVLEVSDVELRTMRDAVQYLKEAADSARALYIKDDSFLLADWRWVTRSTLLRNPLEATFRFQSAMVSYARQYRQGIIQRRTKLTLIAALQYPFDKKVYLDMDIIGSILAVPKWIIWLKENLGTAHEKGLIEDTFSGSEAMRRPLRERVVELFEHAYYEVVITSSTLAVAFVLAGLVRIVMVTPRSNAFIGAIAVEALYLTMFTTEVTVMISAYGQRIMNMDNYNRLDLVLVAVCMFIFTLQCGLFLVNQNELANNGLIICFTLAISLRFLHAIKYAELSLERMAAVVHRYLDAKIYDAYEIGHAIVTGEEEVQQSVWKFVNNDNITAEIRGRATLNRLLVLRRLVEIQVGARHGHAAFGSCPSRLDAGAKHVAPIELIGLGVYDSGSTGPWIRTARQKASQMLHLIRRISPKSGGATTTIALQWDGKSRISSASENSFRIHVAYVDASASEDHLTTAIARSEILTEIATCSCACSPAWPSIQAAVLATRDAISILCPFLLPSSRHTDIITDSSAAIGSLRRVLNSDVLAQDIQDTLEHFSVTVYVYNEYVALHIPHKPWWVKQITTKLLVPFNRPPPLRRQGSTQKNFGAPPQHFSHHVAPTFLVA